METKLNLLSMNFPKGSPEIPVGHPCVGPIGEIVPGKGFRLRGMSSRSYRALINGEISARRVFRERGALNMSMFLNRLSTEPFNLEGYKSYATTQQPYWFNSFKWAGGPGPASAYVPTTFPTGGTEGKSYSSADAGAIVFPSAAPETRYIHDIAIACALGIDLMILVDILYIIGGIPGNMGFPQANPYPFVMGDLPRYTDGEGVLGYAEGDIAGTYGGTTLFCMYYKNQAGTGGRLTEQWLTHPWGYNISRICIQTSYYGPFMHLQAGDHGIRKWEQTYYYFGYQVSDSKAAVGLVKPLMVIPVMSKYFMEQPPYGSFASIIPLDPNACLSFFLRINAVPSRFNYTIKTVKA